MKMTDGTARTEHPPVGTILPAGVEAVHGTIDSRNGVVRLGRHVGSFPARRLRRSIDGTVAVEFAMIAGLVVSLILETLQGGLYLYQQATMENVAARAGRQIMVGNKGSGTMSAQQFHDQIICPMLPLGVPCANVVVDARTVPEGASPGGGFYAYANAAVTGLVAPPTAATATFCTGASGDVVYMRLILNEVAISPAWRAYALARGITYNGSPAYQVVSYVAFRNEPFQGGATC